MMRMAIIKNHDKRTGKTYVYEQTSIWDKEKKQSRNSRKMIGRLDPETGEIIPTRKKKPATKSKDEITQFTQKYQRYHYGASYALYEIARKNRILEGLKEIFPDRYQAIFSLALFLTIAPTNAVHHFEDWSQHYYIRGQHLSSQRISELFKSITEDEKVKFFQWMVSCFGENEYWAYDTTSISSYSEQLTYVQYGHNKENDALPQLNLALLFGEKSRLPFAYRELPGNISDVMTIDWLLNQLEDIQADQVGLVMDRGHYSLENIEALLNDTRRFVVGVSTHRVFVKEAIRQLKDTRTSFHSLMKNEQRYGHHVKLEKIFHYDAKTQSYAPVHLHLYYDSEKAEEQSRKLDTRLIQLYDKLQQGKELNEKEKKETKAYFVKEDDQYKENRSAIEDKKDQYGWQGILTNTKLSTKTVLQLYRNKDVIEKAFNDVKDRLNMRRLHVKQDDSLRGKLFVQFIALILVSFVKNKMDEQDLFDGYTIQQVLNQLNLVDCYLNKEGEMSIGEITQKQRQLFNGLDVTEPTS